MAKFSKTKMIKWRNEKNRYTERNTSLRPLVISAELFIEVQIL